MKPSTATEVITFDHNKPTGEMVATVWSPTAVSSGNACYRFWSKRSSFEKTSITLIILLAAIAITLATLLGIFVTKYQDISAHHDNLCKSQSCVMSSASIIERMDLTADPCIDFYQFACGAFTKSNIAPIDRNERTVLQDMQDQLYVEMKLLLESPINSNRQNTSFSSDSKSVLMVNNFDDSSVTTHKAIAFYQSCMSEVTPQDEIDSAQLLIRLIESSGGQWNLLQMMSGAITSMVDSSTPNLEERIAYTAINQVSSIFNFYVAPATKNSSTYSIHVYPGSSVLDTFYLQNVTLFDDLSQETQNYIDLQLEVVRLLAHIKNGHNLTTFTSVDEISTLDRKNYEIVKQELLIMINFEAELALLAKNYSLDEQMGENPVFVTVADLQLEFDWINWTKLFTSIKKHTNSSIDELVIESNYIGYFKQLGTLLNKYPSKTVDSYLSWCHVSKYILYLGPTFKRMYNEFRKEVPEIPDPNTDAEPEFLIKWKECVHLTSETLKIPTTRLYIDHKYQYMMNVRNRTAKLVQNIRNSFYQIIRKQKWITNNHIKEQLIKRVSSIETKIAFPNFILNQTLINHIFSDLNLKANGTLISNLMAVSFHDSLYELNRVNQPVDSDMDWLLHPLVSNAYYDETTHAMILPIGMLQRPMIMTERPEFLDYSTLGVVIGHELAHSLDKLSDGLLNSTTLMLNSNLTTDKTEQFMDEYTNMTNCFSDQYSAYQLGYNWTVDGNLTLQENICDFAGLQQSFNAFSQFYIHPTFTLPALAQFTPQQLFFIQHAQIWCEITSDEPEQDAHSPGKFRANGVLVNSDAFADVFNCPLGSPMNPRDKCLLWSLD